MKTSILLFAGTLLITVAVNAADEFVADEILVAFQPGNRGAQADRVRNGLGAARIKAWTEISAEHWRLPAGLSVAQAIQALARNPNVLYAEPNYIVHGTEVPSDPFRHFLWGLHNLGQTGGTLDNDADVLEAWAVRSSADTVVVAVIDSGVDYTHPDLAANIWTNPEETGGGKETNGIDDDGNGYIDDSVGWDFQVQWREIPGRWDPALSSIAW